MAAAERRLVVRGAHRVAFLGAAVALGACAAPGTSPTDTDGDPLADARETGETVPGDRKAGGAASGEATLEGSNGVVPGTVSSGPSGPGGRLRTEVPVASDTDSVAFGGAANAAPDRRRPSLPPGTDDDLDRVADAVDRCPGTRPETPVDVHGCALFERVLDGVEFASGDPLLGAAARRALDRLIADLERYPDVRIRLDGHTDNRGTAASNLELSKRRVMSVARYLVAGGIAPARLKPYGYGESRPRAGNATAAGRERNRRIEIGPAEPF